MILTVIVFLLGLYILMEAVDDAGHYSGADRFCLVLRDVATGVSGVMLVWIPGRDLFLCLIHRIPWHWEIDGLHMALTFALALYLWPKMVMRFHRSFHLFRRG